MTHVPYAADHSPQSPRGGAAQPIDEIRDAFLEALAQGPVVVSSPTGSGKSTQVPRWCPGRVLVVEPRRVACRSLAQRVAELEGSALGEAVGYHVRDDERRSEATRVLFATPGIVLRIFGEIERFDVVVLDEFHERGLDVDLLLALLSKSFRGRLVAMSATLEGERVASYLGGRHLHAAGRTHPVDVHHPEGAPLLPDVRGLEKRVRQAVKDAWERPGDVLVFLPGKAEIAGCAEALAGLDADVLQLHGGLTLKEQGRAFERGKRRKVVLATNVAETSITLPGTTAVVDSGLVRRTRYHRGRGFLTLGPIALDSAEQRAGRAGRTQPGVAYRLWSEAARLEKRTPPEIYRESLSPLVLAAAACGARVEELAFLDPPREHAIASAQDELRALGALDSEGRLTDCGRELFGLPLDAPLGRLLVEARTAGDTVLHNTVLDDMIDLVSALAVGRPLFSRPPSEDDEDENRHCDATAMIRGLRQGRRCHPEALRQARSNAKRLRRAHGLAERGPRTPSVDRRRLALTVLAADPRAAHVARRRGRRVAWSNGGTEIELGRQSAVNTAEDVDTIVVLETRAMGLGGRDKKTLVTCAMPVPIAWLLEASLGRDRLAAVTVDGGRAVARIERVYAKRVLAVREEVPEGELARRAVAELFLRGSVFHDTLDATRERLQIASLARRVMADSGGGVVWADEVTSLYPGEVPDLEDWVAARLEALGVESGEDLALLSAEDLLAPELPEWVRSELNGSYPRSLNVLGAVYEIAYDLRRREAVLRQVRGQRHQLPPEFALPQLPGFAIRIEHRGTVRTLREKS